MQSIDDLICSVLRGERPPWPSGDGWTAEALLARARFQGTGALLRRHLIDLEWPADVGAELRHYALQRTMWELQHQHVLRQTLASLTAEAIEPVLIKGTCLAYWLYAEPGLRVRGDTDLLVPLEAKTRTHDVLRRLGYELAVSVSGEFVSYQSSYTKRTPDGSAHTLDVHWKINNSQLLSRLFSYDELRAAAQPLPRLSPHAFGTSPAHALLLACMHRSTHKTNPYHVDGHAHHSADRLIWLYDIHLLAGALQPRQWGEFSQLADAKGLRAVCLDGMTSTRERFGTSYPAEVLESLALAGPTEPPAEYLSGGHLHQQWMDFKSLGRPSNQLRFMCELIFPPAAYMRAKYPEPQSLPWLYLKRGLSGVRKSLARPRPPP